MISKVSKNATFGRRRLWFCRKTAYKGIAHWRKFSIVAFTFSDRDYEYSRRRNCLKRLPEISGVTNAKSDCECFRVSHHLLIRSTKYASFLATVYNISFQQTTVVNLIDDLKILAPNVSVQFFFSYKFYILIYIFMSFVYGV